MGQFSTGDSVKFIPALTNSLVETISGQLGFRIPQVMHLNGGVNDYYNPYKNNVISCDDATQVPQDQIYVPFILTQSGLKPLTSVDMSRRYVHLFDLLANSDAIVVIGYGFNVDDSHINGMFRELVEEKGKKLCWVCGNSEQSTEQQVRELRKKLRITSATNEMVQVIPVDSRSRTQNGVLWLDAINNLIGKV